MKWVLKSVFIIAIVAVAMIGVGGITSSSAINYDDYTISWKLMTDNTLILNGNVPPYSIQNPVTFRILGPTDNLISIDQISPKSDGSFTASFSLNGNGFKKNGWYTVLVDGGMQGEKLEWVIEFELIKNNPSTLDYHKSSDPLTNQPQVHPLVIVGVLFAFIVIALVILKISKKNSSKRDGKDKGEDKGEEDEKPEPTNKIDVDKFVMACELGDEDEFIRKFKSGKTKQEYQKAFTHLLADLMQKNADAIVIMFVRTLIDGNEKEPTIPKRPDPPRLSNASTTTQPLRVIVNWTAPNDGGSKIISYDVYRSATGKSKGFKIVERGIRGLTFMDTLPSVGTWYYDVIATNSIGASPPSLGASITVEGGSSNNGSSNNGSSNNGSSNSGSSNGQAGMTEEKKQDYKTLKLSPGASETEIKNAHRKIITKYHPDKAKTDSERKKFTAITIDANLAKERLMKK